MLAEIEQSHSFVSNPAAGRGVTLTYDSSTSQLIWSQTDGPNLLYIDDSTKITITLDNAEFSANPITYISGDKNFVIVGSASNELTFRTNGAPQSYLNPLALSFNVNIPGVNGISSPPLFMSLPPDMTEATPSATVQVQYSMSNGDFVLDTGVVLASVALLTNASNPPLNILFKLSTHPPGRDVQFNSITPILGTNWPATVSDSGMTLQVTIGPDASRFTSFRFVLDVGGVKVTSPDPILINSTIGDG